MSTCEPLRVVNPVGVTPSQLTYTNVPEDDAPEYVATITYAAGARVIDGMSVYESAQADNTGHTPGSSPTWWTRLGPTNRWAPFDRSYDSQARQASSIVYEFLPDQVVTAFAALNVDGATALRVTMTHPDYPGYVYDRSFDMTLVPLEPLWWGWWFSDRVAPSQSLATDLPSFPGASIRVEIEGGDDLAVGVLLIGSVHEFGLGAQFGTRFGLDDYSRKERNGFGDLELVERAWNKRANIPMKMEWGDVDRFHEFAAEVRATPCLWIGSELFESATIYGIYVTLDIVISHPQYASLDLELRGLT